MGRMKESGKWETEKNRIWIKAGEMRMTNGRRRRRKKEVPGGKWSVVNERGEERVKKYI